MRLWFAFLLAVVLGTAAVSQQNENKEPAQPQPTQSQKKQPQPPPQKPAEPEAKTAQPTPPASDQKPGDDKKEEHYDMAEVAPVVTHHQITVAGKTLKYTATAGRLPIKRGDG